MKDLSQMTMEEILSGGNFTGYTGEDDHELEFAGDNNSFIADGGEVPIEIVIANTASVTKYAWLSPGNVVYTPGADGMLAEGLIYAVGESGETTKTLTVSTPSSQQNVEEFMRYCMKYPTVVSRVEIESNNGTVQSSISFTKRRYNPALLFPEKPVRLNTGLTNDNYREKFLKLAPGELIYISDLWYYKIGVAASSTLTIRLYLGATQSAVKSLENKVATVQKNLRNSPVIQAAKATGDVSKLVQLAG